MGLFLGRYHFFRYLLRSRAGKWSKVRPNRLLKQVHCCQARGSFSFAWLLAFKKSFVPPVSRVVRLFYIYAPDSPRAYKTNYATDR